MNEEYLKLNLYYIPVRTQQRLNREALLNQTNKPNTDKNNSEFIIDNMILKLIISAWRMTFFINMFKNDSIYDKR